MSEYPHSGNPCFWVNGPLRNSNSASKLVDKFAVKCSLNISHSSDGRVFSDPQNTQGIDNETEMCVKMAIYRYCCAVLYEIVKHEYSSIHRTSWSRIQEFILDGIKNFSSSHVLPIALILSDASLFSYDDSKLSKDLKVFIERLGFELLELNESFGLSHLQLYMKKYIPSLWIPDVEYPECKVVIRLYQSEAKNQSKVAQIVEYLTNCKRHSNMTIILLADWYCFPDEFSLLLRRTVSSCCIIRPIQLPSSMDLFDRVFDSIIMDHALPFDLPPKFINSINNGVIRLDYSILLWIRSIQYQCWKFLNNHPHSLLSSLFMDFSHPIHSSSSNQFKFFSNSRPMEQGFEEMKERSTQEGKKKKPKAEQIRKTLPKRLSNRHLRLNDQAYYQSSLDSLVHQSLFGLLESDGGNEVNDFVRTGRDVSICHNLVQCFSSSFVESITGSLPSIAYPLSMLSTVPPIDKFIQDGSLTGMQLQQEAVIETTHETGAMEHPQQQAHPHPQQHESDMISTSPIVKKPGKRGRKPKGTKKPNDQKEVENGTVIEASSHQETTTSDDTQSLLAGDVTQCDSQPVMTSSAQGPLYDEKFAKLYHSVNHVKICWRFRKWYVQSYKRMCGHVHLPMHSLREVYCRLYCMSDEADSASDSDHGLSVLIKRELYKINDTHVFKRIMSEWVDGLNEWVQSMKRDPLLGGYFQSTENTTTNERDTICGIILYSIQEMHRIQHECESNPVSQPITQPKEVSSRKDLRSFLQGVGVDASYKERFFMLIQELCQASSSMNQNNRTPLLNSLVDSSRSTVSMNELVFDSRSTFLRALTYPSNFLKCKCCDDITLTRHSEDLSIVYSIIREGHRTQTTETLLQSFYSIYKGFRVEQANEETKEREEKEKGEEKEEKVTKRGRKRQKEMISADSNRKRVMLSPAPESGVRGGSEGSGGGVGSSGGLMESANEAISQVELNNRFWNALSSLHLIGFVQLSDDGSSIARLDY